MELLQEKKEISQAPKITDPWETPYKIVCGDEAVWVISFGADKKEGTADDIRIPDTTPVPDTKPARTPRPACTCKAGDALCICP